MEVNDVFLHRTEGVVSLSEIVNKQENNEIISYHVFLPYYPGVNSNKIILNSNMLEGRIRNLISKEKATQVIDNIKNLRLCDWIDDNKTRRLTFEEILKGNDPFEYSRVCFLIKRKELEFKGSKKTISKFDSDTLVRIKRILYGELAYVLDLSFDEVDEYFNKEL